MKRNKKYSSIIQELTDRELLTSLYTTQFFLFVLSLVLSWFLFAGFSFWNQLKWSDPAIITIGVPAGVIVVVMDLVLMKLLPSSYYDDGGLNDRLFRQRNLLQIVLIALGAAISEEMFFRGIIQAKTGLFIASLIFAAAHYRYLFNWYLFLNIVLLSFWIGFVYNWTNNLAVTIVMHFVIDFLLGIYTNWKNEIKDKQEGSPNE